jgi:hypothetical protein
MRYLVPATEVHAKLDQIDIPRGSDVNPTRGARKSPASEGSPRKTRRKSGERDVTLPANLTVVQAGLLNAPAKKCASIKRLG